MWGGGRGGIKFIQMFRLKGIVLKSDLVQFRNIQFHLCPARDV